MKIQKMIILITMVLLLVTISSTDTTTFVTPTTSLDSPSNQTTNSIPVYKIGETIKGISYKIDRGKSNHYLKVDSPQGKYLFLTLTTDQLFSHLNISILIYSLQTQKLLRKCLNEQLSSCYIPQQKIQTNESLLLLIQESSGEEYKYQITSYWSNLQIIELGRQVKFIFSHTEQHQLYHLELKNKQFQQLKIIIKPLTRKYAFDRVKMYGTYGKESVPSSQNYDFKSIYLWEDVQGIYLTKKDMKEKSINFILYGEIETIYTMRADLIQDTHHSIELNSKIHEYLEGGEVYDYHLQFDNPKSNKTPYTEFIFRIAKFAGELSLEFFQDKQKKKRVQMMEPMMYMGDIQYMFYGEQMKKQYPKGLFVQAQTDSKFCTYTMQFQGRMAAAALELHEHVYEFLEVEKESIVFIRLAKYNQQFQDQIQANSTQKGNKNNEVMKLMFSLLRVKGNVHASFRKCNEDELACTGTYFLRASEKIDSEIRTIGQKDIYSLYIGQDFWKHVNSVQQNAILIVILSNANISSVKDNKNGNKELAVAAIEYNLGNRPQFLRENKPIEAHIVKDELKTYKYVNTDPNIERIRIFITRISGNVKLYQFREMETEQKLAQEKVIAEHEVHGNILQISENLTTKPIVIIIKGEDSATYSLSLQTVHKDKSQINSITLSQGFPFNTKIGPNKYEIFSISPINSQILFTYKSSGAVHVCQLDSQQKCQQENNFNAKMVMKNEGKINKEKFYNRTLLVKIRNPSSTKVVELMTMFTSNRDEGCKSVKLGSLTQEEIGKSTCISTVINKQKDLQVLIIREEIGQLSYFFSICNQIIGIQLKEQGEERYVIEKKFIEDLCKNHDQNVFVLQAMVWSDEDMGKGNENISSNSSSSSNDAKKDIKNSSSKGEEKQTKMHIKYSIRYSDDRILLPDGIAYHGKQLITEGLFTIFSYKLINHINTSILVISQKNLILLAKLVQSSKSSSTQLTINDYHFTSEKENFYFSDYVSIKLDESAFKKYPCNDCELIIGLYSKDNVGDMLDYTIEVSQNFVMLAEGEPKKAFLLANSQNYYGFRLKSQGKILIQASDNNNNCLQLYTSTQEYPDEKRFNQKSFDGQILADINTDSPMYYITVKARKSCAYTIVASLSSDKNKNRLTKLIHGSLGYANMEEEEVKFYTFRHLSERAIKILSLHNYGHVEFYLNKTTPQQLVSLFKSNKQDNEDTINYKEFTYRSPNKNRLILTKQNSQFCKNCNYLLAVQAVKKTESSIYLGDQDTKVPLTQDKVLNDLLNVVNSSTKAEMFGIKEGNIQIKVHSGKLEVTLQFSNKTITKTFSKGQQLQNFNFDFNSKEENNFFFARLYITFKALQKNTLYSSRIRSKSSIDSQTQPGVTHNKLNSQEPTYAYLQKAILKCYQGYLKHQNQKIFISFSSNDRELAKDLNIVAKLKNNLTSVIKQHTRNVIAIQYQEAKDFSAGAIPFSLCLQSINRSVSVTVFQEEETNLLPQNVQMVVIKEKLYDVYPQGNMLLDVFECRGKSQIAFGSTRKQLQNKKTKILEMIGMPNQPHAVKLDTFYSNIMVKVSGELSLIRWLPINQDQERGMGYYLYEAGKMKYNNVFGEIEFLIDPIKNVKKTSTKIKEITYKLYLSPNQTELQEASNCQLFLGETISTYKVQHTFSSQMNKNNNDNLDKSFKFSLQKNKLMEKYNAHDNLYIQIVADVKISTPNPQKLQEEYRFIYAPQELPSIVFMPNQIEKFDAKVLIIVVVLIILLILVLAWVFKSIVIPFLGKRNRALVEQNAGGEPQPQIKEDNLDPLPSTDRQTMQPETDTRM